MAKKTEEVMVRMSPDEKAALTEIARLSDMTMSEVMRLLIKRSAARYGIRVKAAA